MATVVSSRTYGDPPIPTVTKVDTDTGVSEIFLMVDGEERLAATGAADGTWDLKPRFSRRYNLVTGENVSVSQFEDLFAVEFQKRADKDRALIINKNATKAVRQQLSDSGLNYIKPPSATESQPDQTDDQSRTSQIEVVSNTPGAIATGGSGALYYPESLKDSQSSLRIQVYNYQGSGLGGDGIFGGRESGEPLGKILTTIYLPIAQGASDANTAGWGKGDMTALDAALGSLMLKGMKGNVEGVTTTAEGIAADIGKNSQDAKEVVATLLTEAATGIGKQALQRRDGKIINPNTELLFNNPDLRSFSFNYQLSPRNPSEARMVVNIIRTLKVSMAPRRTQSTLFLKSPNLFKLSYHKGRGGDENEFLNKFKVCALTSLTTNYAPNNNFMSFDDDIPVRYDLGMTFQEIVPVYQDDYQASGVGF